MATYAIGDIQGCYDELRQLLKKINFSTAKDELWLCGDLVNRGPKTLEVLQFASDLSNVKIVLGNHDLHLLAVKEGVRELAASDTLDEVLAAADCDKLCNWLRKQAFLQYSPELNFLMVHAGLPPQWDLVLAQRCAQELQTALQGKKYKQVLKDIFGNQPTQWSSDLGGVAKLRFILNCFTRLRFCDAQGNIDLKCKGAPGDQAEGLMPWYDVPSRLSKGVNIVFGHWAALSGKTKIESVYALDTGCVWGGKLTALCLETGEIYQEDSPGYAKD